MGSLAWGKSLERISLWPRSALDARLGTRARLLVLVLPTVAVFWAGACFVWNHFLRGPYLLDSGWYSAIIYRQGLLPDNPLSAHSIREYYGIHVSPLVSLASLVSYAVPVGRVPYYCLFQGLIYAPLGAVTVLLARPKGSDATPLGAAKVVIGSLLFAFNGQAMSCLGYPHYEIFLSAGVCLLLVGMANGNKGLAWLGVVLAAATREDGGMHAMAFAVAGLACCFSGRPFPLERRVLLQLTFVSGLLGVAAFAIQKLGFHSASLFKHEYLGEPAYGHLTREVLVQRILRLPDDANFIVLPLLGTAILAAVTRDARYFLGWFVELPWLLLNLFAAQDLKSRFSIYTGFPFVASIFWVGAYGTIGRGIGKRQMWLGQLAIVSALSTYGLYYSRPVPFRFLVELSTRPVDVAYSELAAFSSELSRDPDAYGAILVDHGMTSWAIERMPPERSVADLQRVVSPQSFDGIAFFKRGRLGQQMPRFIDTSGYTKCGSISGTDVFLCIRPDRTLPPMFRLTPLGA